MFDVTSLIYLWLLILSLFSNISAKLSLCLLQWYIWCHVSNAPAFWRSNHTARWTSLSGLLCTKIVFLSSKLIMTVHTDTQMASTAAYNLWDNRANFNFNLTVIHCSSVKYSFTQDVQTQATYCRKYTCLNNITCASRNLFTSTVLWQPFVM